MRSDLAARAGMRIGLLGGSFNPAHDGHRHISLLALRLLGLDAVWWVVSPLNPLKSASEVAPFADRLARARSVAGRGPIVVSDIEARLGTRYTVDTVTALRRIFPHARFVWLMGADFLPQLPRWKQWRRIFRLVPVAVFGRAPYSSRALASLAAHAFSANRLRTRDARTLADRKSPAWIFFHTRLHPASATRIRAATIAASAAPVRRRADVARRRPMTQPGRSP